MLAFMPTRLLAMTYAPALAFFAYTMPVGLFSAAEIGRHDDSDIYIAR